MKKTGFCILLIVTLLSTMVLPTFAALPENNTVEPLWTNIPQVYPLHYTKLEFCIIVGIMRARGLSSGEGELRGFLAQEGSPLLPCFLRHKVKARPLQAVPRQPSDVTDTQTCFNADRVR